MFSIKGIDHIVLRTDRIKEMLIAQLRAGDNLIEDDAPFNLNERNLDHFWLRTDSFDLEFFMKYFKDRDVEITQHGMRYGAQGMGYFIYGKDPLGNEIEFHLGK